MILLQIGYWIWVLTCVVSLVQGVLLGLNTWENRRFVRRRVNDPRPISHSRRVALLAPCKGLDLELESNLQHLLRQDYQNYEVVFIVESTDDPALPIIEQLIRQQTAVPARVVIADRATATGQKIRNLAVATSQLAPDVEILAFVDSDICPVPEWLGRLVARLDRPGSGAVTGYRWFAPTQTSLANCLLYSINASIAALLGRRRQYIVWGGSWAIRRSDFEALRIRERWDGTISDDLVATLAIQEAGLPIEFEPTCMTASPMHYSPVELAHFLRRQHQIGRIYAPRIWYQSLTLMIVSTIAFLGAVGLAGSGWLSGADWSVGPCGFLLTWYALQVYRGWLRCNLARIYVRNWTQPMVWAIWFDLLGAPLTLLCGMWVMWSACIGSRISWRGIIYDLDRQGRLLRVMQPGCNVHPGDRHLRFDAPAMGPNTAENSHSDHSVPSHRSHPPRSS